MEERPPASQLEVLLAARQAVQQKTRAGTERSSPAVWAAVKALSGNTVYIRAKSNHLVGSILRIYYPKICKRFGLELNSFITDLIWNWEINQMKKFENHLELEIKKIHRKVCIWDWK